MLANVQGCIAETCGVKQPHGSVGITVRICSHLPGENVHSKSAPYKPPDAPPDVSPKSVTSTDETIVGLSNVPVFKSHKRQRSDALAENSPAQEGFLVRRSHSADEAEQVQRRMDTDDLCKPRAVYPVNFKAPKMYDSPRTTRRSMDLEIPTCNDLSPAPSPAGNSSCQGLRNFNVSPFHKGSFNMAKWSCSRRLNRHRSRADSLCKPQQHQQQQEEDAPSHDEGEGEEEHSQLSIDLERISLAASSVSPFSPSRPTLLPVVFSPIQLVAYRGQSTATAEGKNIEEEEEEDQELVLSLPVSKETSSTNNHSLNNHSYQHYLYQHKHNPVTSMKTSTQPPSFNNNIDFYHNNRAEAVEDADLLDADMLIFNMDV